MSMTWLACMRFLTCSAIRSISWLYRRAPIAELGDLGDVGGNICPAVRCGSW